VYQKGSLIAALRWGELILLLAVALVGGFYEIGLIWIVLSYPENIAPIGRVILPALLICGPSAYVAYLYATRGWSRPKIIDLCRIFAWAARRYLSAILATAFVLHGVADWNASVSGFRPWDPLPTLVAVAIGCFEFRAALGEYGTRCARYLRSMNLRDLLGLIRDFLGLVGSIALFFVSQSEEKLSQLTGFAASLSTFAIFKMALHCVLPGLFLWGGFLLSITFVQRTQTPHQVPKKIRAVCGKPTARVLDPEIADLLPRAGAPTPRTSGTIDLARSDLCLE
jgi:hypothetical protein